MADLPSDWGQHHSTSNPGHVYYFNTRTGANTWDIAEVYKYEEVVRGSQTLPLSEETETIQPQTKRKRIVFDSDTKPCVVAHIFDSKENEKSENTSVTVEQNCLNESSQDFDEDDSSMVMDEEERQELRKLRKYKSPEHSSESPELTVEAAHEKSKENETKKDEMKFTVKSPEDSGSFIPSQEEIKPLPLNPDDFSCRYQNYLGEEKPKYQRELSERTDSRPTRCSPIETEFPLYRRMDNWLLYPKQERDRTPEYDYDTPEEFSDSDSKNEEEGSAQSLDIGHLDVEHNEEEDDHVQEDVSGDPVASSPEEYFGFEVERPPTPPASSILHQLQEEDEYIEKGTVDQEEVEHILTEISAAREFVSKAADTEVESEESSPSPQQMCRPQVVVLDTAVLISSLHAVTNMLECREVSLVVPWQVQQELERLKLSQRKEVELRARAAVRWLNNGFLSHQSNVQAQTAAQDRAVSGKYEARTPADNVLASCLGLLHLGKTVVLATDDVGLRDKAVLHGVKSGNVGTVFDILAGRETEDLNRIRMVRYHDRGVFLDNFMKQARDITREMMEAVIRKELNGEKWENKLNIKQRSSKPDLFQLFNQYIVLFPDQEGARELRGRLQIVKEHLEKKKFSKIQDVNEVFNEVLNLIETFEKKDTYEGLLSLCKEKVLESLKELYEFSTQPIQENPDVDEATQNKVLDLLTTTWQIIFSYTCGFAEALQVPHNLESPELKIEFVSRTAATLELPGFFSSVSDLYKSMEKVVEPPENDGK